MTKKTKDQAEDTRPLEDYFIPELGRSVQARSFEDAIEQAKKLIKKEEVSDGNS